ncbi:alpha amylase [Coleophoma crateriformis]|uniref:Alpha amylase n=1 Tax=Coleophoma crateriformis TaxID=565419 RepID=A0A3D8RV99_9HELO|nr:alpha amylase [Coleophoma crateriformis]
MTSSSITNGAVVAGSPQHRAWWKEASVYQIYPASYKDSTGSGVGDLKGIISKMDYMKALGVDVVWLSPIFESPQIDMGYDISNYRKIAPEYGDISDVDTLMHGLHDRGMKLLMDLVVNHTSDQHEWFKQSRSSKDNEYRDWYVWRKPRYDEQGVRQPPNNWESHFQGNAWEYDEHTEEYYLHLYCKEQPDLNWEHPPVRDAVHAIMRFWLDRGIDGFRLDVINFISKPQDFPDSKGGILPGTEYYSAGPRLHEYLQGVGKILKEYNAFSVGEMPFVTDLNEVIKAVRYDRDELNMIFHFELMDIDHGPEKGKFTAGPWPLTKFKGIVSKWQQFMHANGGWNALYLENHDQPRSVSRFADDSPEHREQSAKCIAVLQGFQAGTPFIYQGQELGMTNVPKEWGMDEYKDIDCLNHWTLLQKATTDPKVLELAKIEYQKKSRDNARIPMQWDSSKNAGFTLPESTPWMSANPNASEINAAAQTDDPTSTFSFWSSVLKARKQHKDIIVYGDFGLVDEEHPQIFAYLRKSEAGQPLLVACNFSADTVEWKGIPGEAKEVVLTTTGKKTPQDMAKGVVSLAPYEAVAVLL